MSSTSQVTTFSDLYTDLQNRARVTTGVSATETQAKRYINSALQDIHMSFDYKLPWTERRTTLLTHAPYSTGTISASVGSTTVTGSATLWDTLTSYGDKNVTSGGYLKAGGESNIYQISTVTNDTSLTLATRYVGTSALSASVYTIFQNEYALASDYLRPVDIQSFTDDASIPLISRAEFRRLYPRPSVSGRPKVACLIDMAFSGSATPIRKIVLYPYPDNVYVFPYTYISNVVAVSAVGVESTTLSGDTDQPTMPLRYRHLIVLKALADWYRDKRDDTRSESVKAEYIDAMQRMVNDQDIATHVKAQLMPRADFYARHARQPYSKRGGRRVDINGEFDRFAR